MNNLNITQNSNDLNESEKTQEKLYSNEASLDDILTYSEDLSQNLSSKKPPSKNNKIKEEENKKNLEQLNKNQIQIIRSFNSEVTMSFLNKSNDNNNITNKDFHSKSASKSQSQSKDNDKENKNLNKSSSYFKSISFSKSNNFDVFDFNTNNNLKDISEIHMSLSNILSNFEIKDISISRSINDNAKKINSEKKKHNLNNDVNNDNCLSLRSENLFINNKGKSKSNNQILMPLNINKNQISEDQSNTNSMCNYQNVSNLNDISNNKNINKKDEKNKENSEKKTLSELSIKLNMSLDNCNDKKYKNDKLKFLDEIDEPEFNKKENYTTSNKKENSFNFSNQKNKIMKNSLKYTKAQCVNVLLQNNNIFNNIDNNQNYIDYKQFCPSDNPIKTKDTTSTKNEQNINKQKIVSLSPHKLTFEIQKNDCIQISINKKSNDNASITNNNPSINNDQSSLSINKAYDFSSENNLFYNNECLKKNNTTSFMIYPNNKSTNKNTIYYQRRSLNRKQIFINNSNLNNHKEDSNNFFYNPKNKIFNHPSTITNKMTNIKKNENELHTPDLNKNKVTPMTCVHKGSLVYCNDNSQLNNDNTIKINKVNNCTNNTKKNNYSFTKNNIKNPNNSNYINKPKKSNQEKKLVYLKNNINKNNRYNNSKIKKNSIKTKNNSFIKNNINYLSTTNKNQHNKKIISKPDEKEKEKDINKKKELNSINNSHKTKIKRNLNIKNTLNSNTNSINSVKNRKNIVNKIKTHHKNNNIIDKINNDLIKESSLFSILYNNLSQKAVTKNNSRPSSNEKAKEEKESTIVHKKGKNEKIVKFPKKVKNENKNQKLKNLLDLNIKSKIEKKLVKHNTNKSFSIYNYNSFLERGLDEFNKKNLLQNKNNNADSKNRNRYIKTNDILNKIKKNDSKKKDKDKIKINNIISKEKIKKDKHKKVNTQINLNALTSNFNFINEERRKNNKSLYNFGNIYFINQNQIVKNDIEEFKSYNNENINSNYISNTNNNNKSNKDIKLKEINEINKKRNSNQIKENNNKIKENNNINYKLNSLNISTAKQSPKIIMDFSKYRKKADYRTHFISLGGKELQTLNAYNPYNKIEYDETQLISEN